MQDRAICEGCGKKLQAGSTICLHCGWDQTTALAQPERPSLLEYLAKGGWRLVVYGLIILLPVLGFMRLRSTGPGPDLATTLRWMAFGDGGRAAELETIHRMHEIGSAASRYAVREMELPFGAVINRYGIGNDAVGQYCQDEGIDVLLHIADDRRIAEAYSSGSMIADELPDIRRQFDGLLTDVDRMRAQQHASRR